MSEEKSPQIGPALLQEISLIRIAFGHILERGWLANIRRVHNKGVMWSLNSIRLHLKAFIAHFINKMYDRYYNIDTAGLIPLENLDLDGNSKASAVHYEPVSPKAFRQMMRHLPDDLQQFTFVDFGSGKGRTLLLASNYNFKGVIGIELSKSLHEIAQKNINKLLLMLSNQTNIQSLHMNAVDFPIKGENYILFFFCPFQTEIARIIVDNVNKGMFGKNGCVFLCYVDEYWSSTIPIDVFEQAGFSAKVGMTQVPWDIGAPTRLKFVIYQRTYRRSADAPLALTSGDDPRASGSEASGLFLT